MNLKSGWITVMILALLAGCVTPSAPTDTSANGNRPRVALVLGGGAARGFAHVGVVTNYNIMNLWMSPGRPCTLCSTRM
jgi:NTE family protein